MNSRWKWLVGIIAVCSAPFLFILGMHFKAKHDLAAYKKQLIAQGEKLTIFELIPKPVAAENNGAEELRKSLNGLSAIKQDGLPSMKLVLPGKARAIWTQEETFDAYQKQRTNIWPTLRENMAKAAHDLERLHQALEKPQLSFRPQYEMGIRALLPHFAKVKQASQWLAASALLHLHENQPLEAAAGLKDAIRLPVIYEDEPMMISQLVRIATVQIAFAATWEALQYEKWDETTLKEFQNAWSQLDFKNEIETTFAMERAMGIPLFEECRKTNVWDIPNPTLKDDLDQFSTKIFNDPKEAFELLMRRPKQTVWQWWWTYNDERFFIEFLQKDIAVQRAIKRDKSYIHLKKGSEEPTMIPEQLLLSSILVQSNRRFFLKCAIAETEREMAVAACALERYRKRFSKYPEKLENLIPEFISQLPRDVLDGEPMRYHRNDDGTFLLYSIGEDGIDDGGDPEFETASSDKRSIQMTKGRDWVWPRRATEGELKIWEELLKKQR